MLDHIEPYSARQAVENLADGFIDIALHRLTAKTADSIKEVMQDLSEEQVDDASAYHMTLEDQLCFLEQHADDGDFAGDDLTLGNLRTRIEGMSCFVIYQIAQQVVNEFFAEISEVIDDYGLDISQITDSNGFGWAVHRSERDEGDHCTVYEYRNVEECNVDVWHFFCGAWEVYINQWIDESNEE